MNETIETLKKRRSCKRFRPEPISREMLDAILEAGTYAANGRGNQAAKIVAVLNQADRDLLSKWNAEVLGSASDPFYGAPVVLVVLGDQRYPTYLYDGALVMGNLMNAAYSLGVGSCWIHRAKEVFASERGKAWLAAHGVEGDYEGIGHCVLGYPDGPERPAAPRKSDFVTFVE